MSIDDTLAERGNRYGEFTDHANIVQELKYAMRNGDKWDELENDQTEALEMIAHKIGRILNGDPNYIDSWTDIIGYARLIEKRLIARQAEGPDTYDNPDCPVCHPETAKAKPAFADVAAALRVLLDAGVIHQADEDDGKGT